MKTDSSPSRTLHWLVMTALTLLGAAPAGAATVIDYDGTNNYLTSGNVSAYALPAPVTEPGENPTWRTWKYSDTNPISTSGGTYTGPALYGGFQLSGTSLNYASTTSFRNDYPSGSNITRAAFVAGASNTRLTGVIAFKTDPNPGTSIRFDAESTLTYIANLPGLVDFRFVLKNGDDWFVANTVLSPSTSALTVNALTLSWAPINFVDVAPLPTLPGAEAYTISGSTFTEIEAVGFYFVSDRTTNLSYFTLQQLTVNAEVVPEPQALLSFGALGLAFIVWRRRSRS